MYDQYQNSKYSEKTDCYICRSACIRIFTNFRTLNVENNWTLIFFIVIGRVGIKQKAVLRIQIRLRNLLQGYNLQTKCFLKTLTSKETLNEIYAKMSRTLNKKTSLSVKKCWGPSNLLITVFCSDPNPRSLPYGSRRIGISNTDTDIKLWQI